MANLLNWYGPEEGTTWNQTRLFRSTTETGTYTLIITLPVTTTTYFDEYGSTTDWYKIAFYDSNTGIQGPTSNAFYAATAPTLYCTVTELRKFMQLSAADYPNTEEATLLLEQAHVLLPLDATGISSPSQLKLLALLLGSSFVCRSLASRSLSKGYISVSLEGGSIMKAHDALMRMSEYYFDKYQEMLAKFTVDYASTSFMANSGVDITTIQEVKDIMNGVSDALDYQSSYMPSNSRYRDGY